jgi:two-component system NtrC family response regulator
MIRDVSNKAETGRLLIVDDDPSIISQLRLALMGEYDVYTATDPESAWKIADETHPDLMTLDLALADGDPDSGFRLLDRCLGQDPLLKVVLITGNDQKPHALRAVERGAADFLGKPVDIQELRILLRRHLAVGRLEREAVQIPKDPGEEDRLGALIGKSSPMRTVFRTIQQVAPTDVSVLILGESGTGKELVAKELHALSHRAEKPYVSINCAAIPENLLESELFGHERGAFTGAHVARAGRLERAQAGTVFLDEVGELPVQLQVKILRFLQDHEIERIGGRDLLKLDVRVIAATSRNLEEEVASGRFREDLYYRLSVVNVKLPPLRDRWNDILTLAQYFLEKFGSQYKKNRLALTPMAKQALRQHPWPGNVRELEHRIQKAVVMSRGRLVDATDLELATSDGKLLTLRESRIEGDRKAIIEALRRTGGNISRAAEILRVSRPSLHELLTKHNIEAQDYKVRTRSGVN